MDHWEHRILYSYSKATGGSNWQWEIVLDQNTILKGMDEITAYLNRLGEQGWELVTAMPINWQGGETRAFQMFLKRHK